MFSRISQPASILPLATFRVCFGLMMCWSIIRFWSKGWIEELYLRPPFHFHYFGFEWISPLPGNALYFVFGLMLLSAAGIMTGAFYRVSAIIFFLTFTYTELIDKATYLNHYYFISLAALLMIYLPANRQFSLDVWMNRVTPVLRVPAWMVWSPRMMLSIVYFYAGVAKLNSDWLFHAYPLRIWLPAHMDLPFVGGLMDELWLAFAFSWAGAAFDLLVPFCLWNERSRPYAYAAVVGFHVITGSLFQIGMFPWIMILATWIFFSDAWHTRFQEWVRSICNIKPRISDAYLLPVRYSKLIITFLGLFFCFQLLFPFRYLAYGGNRFWHEQGFRFGWRVMLIEKAGYALFRVTRPDTRQTTEVEPSEFLTPLQEKQMAMQPDMILEFAHLLDRIYARKWGCDPEVRADVFVSLNGRASTRFIDPDIDLSREYDSFAPKTWILPFPD